MSNRELIRIGILFLLGYFTGLTSGKAQTNSNPDYPVIGKPCPDFILDDVNYFSKEKVSLKDFKGKPLILDMFSLGCVVCFKSFPKMNDFSKTYGEKVQIMLVGQKSKARIGLLKNSYEKYKDRFGLEMPVAYDSALFSQFRTNGVPHIVWIDKYGIVKAITGEVTKEAIEAFIEGRDFELEDISYNARNKKKNSFNKTIPFLTYNNGGEDTAFLQRSLLSKWDLTKGQYFQSFSLAEYETKNSPLEILGFPLESLYRYAFFGYGTWGIWSEDIYKNVCYLPKLEVKDSSLFQFKYASGKNIFCYSLILPKEKRTFKNMQEIMQRDLQNFFGYEVSIEVKKMPYLRLVSSNTARINLKTRGGELTYVYAFDRLEGTAITIPALLSTLEDKLGMYSSKNLPIIDETGIIGKIDIKISAVMTDFEDVRKGLQKNGLDLVIGEKEMKILVIRDPKPGNK